MVVCRNTASGIFPEGQGDDEISWDQRMEYLRSHDEISVWDSMGFDEIRWDSTFNEPSSGFRAGIETLAGFVNASGCA